MSQNILMKEKYKNILVRVLKMIIYYIMFFILFTFFISITEFFIINLKGGNTGIIEIYYRNFTAWQIILLFLILFISLNIILYIYDTISIKILNNKLLKMKRRVNNNA